METLRTPDDRFADLEGYPFEPNYAEIADGDGGSLRVHYLDEGPAGADPVLLLHGEPSWSYLYRHMIPALVSGGRRCVVPDLVGFGRSDKPAEQDDYTYQRHVDWMSQLVFGALGLEHITFFGQDWGGLIGLRLLAAEPERYDRVVASNTGLPTGEGRISEAFLRWQQFSREAPMFPIGSIVAGGCRTQLSERVIAGYDAPFPDDSYKAGARRFPSLVPTSPDDPAHDANVAAWKVLRRFERPFLCAFSDSDPITAGGDRVFRQSVPGAEGRAHVTIEGGGHFVQEDRGEQLAAVVNAFIDEG